MVWMYAPGWPLLRHVARGIAMSKHTAFAIAASRAWVTLATVKQPPVTVGQHALDDTPFEFLLQCG